MYEKNIKQGKGRRTCRMTWPKYIGFGSGAMPALKKTHWKKNWYLFEFNTTYAGLYVGLEITYKILPCISTAPQ